MVTPAVEVAKSRNGLERKEIVLADGRTARVIPVAATLIDEVTSKVRTPPVPMWHNPDKDRDEPNPSDPLYLQALQDANKERGTAALDAMILFGLELVEGVPDDDNWLRKLHLMERMGKIDLKAFDLKDPIDIEFLYKRYIVASSEVIQAISEASGVTGAEIAEAEESFRGN